MNIDSIIDKIELAYSHYLQQGSEIMFTTFTDHFFDKLESIPACQQILNNLVFQYNIPQDEFEKCIMSESFLSSKFFVNSEAYYVAYCYQYYKFLRNRQRTRGNFLNPYYNEVTWTDRSFDEHGDRMILYKTDYVRPIVNYVIDNLKSESLILYNLNRYKNRVERFRTISYCEGLSERQLQKDLALYLFDNHVEFSKEDDTCNGRLDFKLSDDSVHYGSILNCNNKPYIVEIKLLEKVRPTLLQKSINQLSAYMGQIPSYGCLVIFTPEKIEGPITDLENQGITIIPIYIGNLPPSSR
jgi:hypothetical protein